jgi:hypothetical protein
MQLQSCLNSDVFSYIDVYINRLSYDGSSFRFILSLFIHTLLC